MVIEYFIDKDNYKKPLKSLDLSTSNSIKVTKRSYKRNGKDNYLLQLSTKEEGRDGAKALSEVNKRVYDLLKNTGDVFRLLINEASQYYTKQLYPLVCEFETKLRKFIHSVLFDINEKAQTEIYKRLKKAKIIKDEKIALSFNFLDSADLADVQEFLFANDETLKAFDELKKDNKNRFASKEELIKFIENNYKNTIWEEFFAKDFSDSILPSKFQELKDYRNDVMHFHEMDDTKYEMALNLFQDAIKDLDKQIKKDIVIEETDDNIQILTNNISYFNETLKRFSELSYTSENLQSLMFSSVIPEIKIWTQYSNQLEKYRKMYDEIISPPYMEWLKKIRDIKLQSSVLNISQEENNCEDIEVFDKEIKLKDDEVENKDKGKEGEEKDGE